MDEETDKNDNRSRSDIEREERRAKEQAERNERRSKEQAERNERREKEKAARNVKQSKGALEKQAAREEAKGLGIDTKGMSTREIKGAVSEAKKVEEDMMKFIEKSLVNFTAKKGDAVAPKDAPATTTSRITEDKPSPLNSIGGTPRTVTNRPQKVKFGCYQNGVLGYFDMLVDGDFISE